MYSIHYLTRLLYCSSATCDFFSPGKLYSLPDFTMNSLSFTIGENVLDYLVTVKQSQGIIPPQPDLDSLGHNLWIQKGHGWKRGSASMCSTAKAANATNLREAEMMNQYSLDRSELCAHIASVYKSAVCAYCSYSECNSDHN